MDAPRRSSRGGSHRERRSRARALGNEARHRLRHVSLRAEGCVRGEAETRAESARGRSAGAVSVSRASRVSPRAFDTPGRDAGADEARIRTRAAGGGHARRAGRCREREDGDAPTRRKSRAARRVGAAAPNAKASFEARARPSGRERFHPRGARGERRREKRSAGRRVPAGRGARRLARRRGTKKRNDAPVVDVDWSTAGDRLVTACEAGDVRVWSRCVGASSDDEDDGSETWRCSPRRRARRRRTLARPGRREPPAPARKCIARRRTAAPRGCRRAFPPPERRPFLRRAVWSAERVGGERQHGPRLRAPRGERALRCPPT